MKDLLIIFAILLFVLIIISTLGGSISSQERFSTYEMQEAVKEAVEENMPPMNNVEYFNEELVEQSNQQQEEVQVEPEHFYDEGENEEPILEGFDGDQWATVNFQ